METSWVGAKTTPELIAAIKEAGFNTIRIPVSWHNHVDENDVIGVLASCGLPTECPFDSDTVFRAAMGDKKRSGKTITLGVLNRIGEARLEQMDMDAFREFVRLGVE